jgi:hypothetical protein
MTVNAYGRAGSVDVGRIGELTWGGMPHTNRPGIDPARADAPQISPSGDARCG